MTKDQSTKLQAYIKILHIYHSPIYFNCKFVQSSNQHPITSADIERYLNYPFTYTWFHSSTKLRDNLKRRNSKRWRDACLDNILTNYMHFVWCLTSNLACFYFGVMFVKTLQAEQIPIQFCMYFRSISFCVQYCLLTLNIS